MCWCHATMVSRSNDSGEIQIPPSPTPWTPGKTRPARSGTSPTKKDEKMSKSSAKDVSELKDFVRPSTTIPTRASSNRRMLTRGSNWEIAWVEALLDLCTEH